MSIDVVIDHLIKNRRKFSTINPFSKLPGIYAIFFCGHNFPLKNINPNEDDIIYLGKTESSQEKRDAKTHFKSGKTGSSTLRKTIGSLLREQHMLKPIIRSDSDVLKRRFSHFKFDDRSESIITEWMQNNLALSFFEYAKTKKEIEKLETSLIQKTTPILNIAKNQSNPVHRLLKQMRKESAKLAFKDVRVDKKEILSKNVKGTKMSTGSQNLYADLWQGYINQISQKIVNSNDPQTIQLEKNRFNQVGDRKSYSFNLEYKNGIVNNNIGGSAVARDLDKVISKSESIKSTLKNGYYKINLNKDFVLTIRKLEK